jgi:hypothetical protein
LTDWEKALKQTSRRNGCTGSWKSDRRLEFQKRMDVPCIRAWPQSSNERRRKAGFDKVAKVKGRKRRICKAVDNLAALESAASVHDIQDFMIALAVNVTVQASWPCD